ncbi:hypothetical protein [Bacillus sp. JCM 19034]|uniref:hypothetical protein n=1 Tax=Bacillus sp. JCM 19034 TaxID=1481928 RepID=UPI000785E5E6|nr:hypothetical protein [Bacillus sp. JCM 19034]
MAVIIVGDIQPSKSLKVLVSDAVSDGCNWMTNRSVQKCVQLAKQGHKMYLPAETAMSSDELIGCHVYFELECLPFYSKAKEMIQQGDRPSGVFRYRRKLKTNGHFESMISDLYVLSRLFGNPLDTHVKQSKAGVNPAHTIVTLDFGNGRIAHLEYTESEQKQIELEWSGIGKIIEFNSEEMVSLSTETNTLTIPIQNIFKHAQLVNQQLLDQLQGIEHMLTGGVQS